MRYGFDKTMSKGLLALIGWLGLTSLLFVTVMATVVTILDLNPEDKDVDFAEAFWASLLRTLDPGTMGQDTGIGFRLAMLVVTLGGLVLVAGLISVVSNAFNERVNRLQEGRSKVLESDHVLILGWSTKLIPVVRELCLANKNKEKNTIVILADVSKTDLERNLDRLVHPKNRTRMIVRRGDTKDPRDLELVNALGARSIILFSQQDESHNDISVLSSTLALVNDSGRNDRQLSLVGEIQSETHRETATMIAGDSGHWVLANDVISRITVQTLRQRGLSTIVTELLDFEGNEMCIVPNPFTEHTTFGHAVMQFSRASLIGLVRNSQVELNPHTSVEISTAESLIFIADNPRDAVPERHPVASLVAPSALTNRAWRKPEKALLIGFNSSVPFMLRELDKYLARGSSVVLLNNQTDVALPELRNISLTVVTGNQTHKATLEGLSLEQFDHISVVSNRDTLAATEADATTLITLVHLRKLAEEQNLPLNIVSEMLDDKNREIAEVARDDDFIVSDKLVSLMLAQVAVNFHLSDVFNELFSSTGSEIYIRPASDYCELGVQTDVASLYATGLGRNETVIGLYRPHPLEDFSAHRVVTLNPTKSNTWTPISEDGVIVLAER